jgi:hypothetical protein
LAKGKTAMEFAGARFGNSGDVAGAATPPAPGAIKGIPDPRNSFYISGSDRVVANHGSQLANASVDPGLEIDVGSVFPEQFPDRAPRDQLSRVHQEGSAASPAAAANE